MARLTVFNSVTMDGFFTGKDGDLSWAHGPGGEDPEWNAYVQGNAKGGGTLVFGRVTYEMMKSYWPTPEAKKQNPLVAGQMNKLPKIVFSKSLGEADWSNTRLVKGDIAAEVRKMKQAPGEDMVIMGSGSVISQLAQENLIDEYTLVVVPVVLGHGRTMFEDLDDKQPMKLVSSRTFKNGNVVLIYDPK